MNPAFEKLPERKKQKILTVAIEEFAMNGYENASTNKMTERAQISKGLLFHYFTNKKGLYLYLFEHVMGWVSNEVIRRLETLEETDFFERIKKTAMLKIDVFLHHPDEYHFMMKGILEPTEEVKEEIQAILLNVNRQYSRYNDELLFAYLNEDDLRVGLTKEFVVEYVMNVMEQFSNSILKQYKGKESALLHQSESLLKRLDMYVDVLKYGVYRP
ncbi:TetR/AcrR family transcriptional regulator [Pseudalkalibacillus sp. SCS-8]|uniref:TetR/AcrR family transcriptional regulator n=1 Tax=Pseudalkalibacillus nanhaiensis TaxID=3115291 RepID=UPI0032DBCC9B